jgi:phospholipid/cholesterol/gamma-HCH transport system ATP-binding protein
MTVPVADRPAARERGGQDGAVPAVRLDHVTKAFGDRKVLDDVSFDVPDGSAFIILGRSGTGKSVTLRHIIGLVQPDSGHVYVHGSEISGSRGAELAATRRQIGFLFQNAALFDSISVGENVAFPMRRHTRMPDGEIRAKAQEKLRAVGLEREYNKMPADLSGGMKKRAGLARALSLDPRVLLVDEPSAGLDPITSGEIDDLLAGLKGQGGTTLIVVTHNIPSARHIGDQLLMLHEGRIVARGSPGEFERSDNDMVQAFMASKNAG